MDETVHEKHRVALGAAIGRLARCAVTTAGLLARRRVHLPEQHVGRRLTFADGTTGTVYRETVVDRGPVAHLPIVPTLVSRRRRHLEDEQAVGETVRSPDGGRERSPCWDDEALSWSCQTPSTGKRVEGGL